MVSEQITRYSKSNHKPCFFKGSCPYDSHKRGGQKLLRIFYDIIWQLEGGIWSPSGDFFQKKWSLCANCCFRNLFHEQRFTITQRTNLTIPFLWSKTFCVWLQPTKLPKIDQNYLSFQAHFFFHMTCYDKGEGDKFTHIRR